MKALFTAITNKFTATSGSPAVHNAFYIALGGRLYNTVAPQPPTYPFCVFTLVTGTHEWTFTEEQELCHIQFSLFDSSQSAGTICDNYELLTALFDDCSLTITGYDHLYMQRESEQLIRSEEDPGYWQYIVEYNVFIEET